MTKSIKFTNFSNQQKSTAQAYQASSSGRRLSSYTAPNLGPNTASLTEIDVLRRRSRAALRNNPWIKKGVNANVANEIGTGIVPRSKAPDDDFKAAIRELWADWQTGADADGILSAYGIQQICARARMESGEVFIRIRKRRENDDLAVPLQFQVLEADYCPASHNTVLKNGNRVLAGIEFNKQGKRTAYWMHTVHPAEQGLMGFDLDLVRIPADQIIHHYIPTRPGQIRGEPTTIQALVKAFHFDQYDDAELERKKTRANYTGVITKNFPTDEDAWRYDPITGEPTSAELGEESYINAEPGTFPSLLPGEALDLFPGDQTGTGYAQFVKQQLLGIAAGLGVPYELLSGDYSAINDRTWRAIMNQYRREIEQIQQLFTIQHICIGMWQAFVDSAILSGKVKAKNYITKRSEYLRADFRPQAWAYIHPTQDVAALRSLIDGGLDSRQSIVAGRGRDVEEVDAQRKEDATRSESMGLTENNSTKTVKQVKTKGAQNG